MNRKTAFTLVELLVVVGIIAVLIAMLMPALAKARYEATVVSCASNERQYVAAIYMYAADNKGYLPRFDFGPTGLNVIDVGNQYYDVLYNSYGVPFQTFFCPASSEYLTSIWDTSFGFFLGGYEVWIPRMLGPWTVPPDPGSPLLTVNGTALIRSPIKLGEPVISNTNPVLTDTALVHDYAVGDPTTFDVVHADQSQWWSDYSAHFWKGHYQDCNEAFIDGHVERIAAGALILRYRSGNAWDCW